MWLYDPSTDKLEVRSGLPGDAKRQNWSRQMGLWPRCRRDLQVKVVCLSSFTFIWCSEINFCRFICEHFLVCIYVSVSRTDEKYSQSRKTRGNLDSLQVSTQEHTERRDGESKRTRDQEWAPQTVLTRGCKWKVKIKSMDLSLKIAIQQHASIDQCDVGFLHCNIKWNAFDVSRFW